MGLSCYLALGRMPWLIKRSVRCLVSRCRDWSDGHVCHKGTLAHTRPFFVQSSFASAHAAHKGRKQLGGLRCGQGCNVQSCTSASEAAGISETAVAKMRCTLRSKVIRKEIF